MVSRAVAYFMPVPGPGERAAEVSRHRLFVVASLFVMAFCILGGRLIYISMLSAGQERVSARTPAQLAPNYARADIRDRNGVLLATTLATASVYANPSQIHDVDGTIARLRSLFPELEPQWLRARLTAKGQFSWIKRNITPRDQQAVNELGLPGVYFQREERRVYPHGAAFAHVLGYVDVDNAGLAGVERAFNDMLSSDPATPVVTALDMRVQYVLRDAMQWGVKEFQALGAAGTVLDVRTGEVLAMSSMPDFDPHTPGKATQLERFNRNTLGVYEMGSTFKSFTVAMALDSGKVTMEDGYDATHPLRMARFTISDSHPKARWLSIPEIFVYSSNIGTAKIFLDMGLQRQHEFLKRMGLLDPLDIELLERTPPLVPAMPWKELSGVTMSFGHGISVTPLHLARATAALINGGTLEPITFLKREGAPSGKRVVSEQTSEHMRDLLRRVVEKGTGWRANLAGYRVGGKTGTAEKAVAGGYDRKAMMSSFIAAFPMDDPQYLVLVMLDEPKGTEATHGYATGGATAAQVVAKVIEGVAPILEVTPVMAEAEQPPVEQ
ncbi:MAG: penicillin-binding protein 2 [Alphaproteobacteria bacterium]|nr:penicillin-binding protein 2 [Alphaproteobacteria bacterium]